MLWSKKKRKGKKKKENYKMFERLFWGAKGVGLPISLLSRIGTGHPFIDLHKTRHTFCSADGTNSLRVFQPHQL